MIDDEIVEVSACLSTLDKRDDKEQLIEIDDNAICTLRSQKGIVGILEASWIYYGESNNSTTLYCTNGIMKIYENPEYPIEIVKKNGEREFYKVPPEQNSKIMDCFAESIVNNDEPLISGEEGFKALKIILACMESSEKGRKVSIDYTI